MARSTKGLVIAGVLAIVGFVAILLFDDWKVVLSLIPFTAALIVFLNSLKQLAQEEIDG